MSSIPGLPPRGSDVTVLITRVHVHPLCVFVEFWGKFSEDKNAEYQCLAKDIQFPGNIFQEHEGNPGDQCLVQVGHTWQRARIVSRSGSYYRVFLIDKGEQCLVANGKLAWGKKEHFYLPPEVEFCVLGNAFPLLPNNRWSPTAMEFLRTLSGKSVKAYVQDVLVSHRTFVLHIPYVSKQMHEMGFAKRLSADDFLKFLFASLSQSETTVSPKTQLHLMRNQHGEVGEPLHKQQLFMYPELELGTVEHVIVTEVTNPQKVFCQLKVFSLALDKLSEQMTQCYEGREASCDVSDMVGLPCAVRGSDGRWSRSVLQQVSPSDNVVKVLNVDSGKKQFVRRENVRSLAAEFLRMPIVTYMCSLRGIVDKDVTWTATQIDYLKSLLLHKTVSAKFESQNLSVGVYYVTLYDSKNRNLNKLFGSKENCLVEYNDDTIYGFTFNHQHPPHVHGDPDVSTKTQKQIKAKVTIQPAMIPTLQNPDTTPSVRGSGNFFQTQKPSPFKEQMFPVRTVLDVTVSYIESPNDFWCQVVQKAGHLKLLMHDLQLRYESSEFEPFFETACVVRHPDNRMWYRALVIHRHEGPDVDVLFIDYGQMETVSLYDLRKIKPEFQTLEGQAFHCSLLNPIDPSSVINDWGTEATAKFHDFVDTATSNHMILKCTIYAVTYSEQNIVFNVVDLTSPFENVCTQMVNLIKGVPLTKPSAPSVRLDAYNYSTHNVKTGTEESVTVTSVNSVSHFYCQLDKNADVVKDLDVKVNNLCHQLKDVKVPTDFGTLCFAKYTDGHWYRAQIKATEPSIWVHFVDYGDTIEVNKSDLLPVPKEAHDIMSVPVQAVRCALANLPASVPREVDSWVQNNVTDCKFRALIVAREPNGKLLVELYHGNTQISSKIKKLFHIDMHREEQVDFRGRKALETSGNHKPKTANAFPKQDTKMEDHTQKETGKLSTPNPTSQLKDEKKSEINLQLAPKPFHHVCENASKPTPGPLKLYQPPQQRRLNEKTATNMGNDSEQANAKPKKKNLPTGSKQLIKSTLPDTESQKKSAVAPEVSIAELPKLTDLPSKSITPGMEADVFVSHCNSPSSFYVQFVKEEDEIFSIVEKLNDGQSTLKITDMEDVHPGDLVQAEFPADSSWYRAVVREIHENMTAVVEFVDFGNTAVIPVSKICRLQKQFLEHPTYCTHCTLSEAAGLGKEEVLDPDVVSAFRKNIGSNGENKLKCRFIRELGSVWEVSLQDGGVEVMCKVPARDPAACTEITLEKPEQVKEELVQDSELRQMPETDTRLNTCPLHYCEPDIQEGQHLKAYVMSVNNDQSFWCQSADAQELDKLTNNVSEVGNAADHIPVDAKSLLPGSPCIALYTEDEQWYRAKVISKDEEKLCVLFVDYGNKSEVNVNDVREIAADLVETPPQAFLCELEGFDASRGSWDSGAADELSALTTDKLLQLTVLRITREGKIKCFVRIECEGQIINETLKTWWRSSTTENKPVGVEPSESQPYDTSMEQTVVPEAPSPEESENPIIEEIDAPVACMDFERDQREEQSAEEQ
ncbi:hypothetical protein LDENG_00266540 [Lucifuga dentata]|nr:hypothetical protein LDENG_00266540 [Lucifuga dentata]